MNWYVNQEIVCIENHSKRIVKEGELFTIRAIKKNECYKCFDGLVFDVGIKSDMRAKDGSFIPLGAMMQCNSSHGIIHFQDGIYWLSEKLFKPLDELADISELTEILSQPIEELFKA